MSTTYPNPITTDRVYDEGESFIFHANPAEKALATGTVIALQTAPGYYFGYGVVTEEIGPNTYRAVAK